MSPSFVALIAVCVLAWLGPRERSGWFGWAAMAAWAASCIFLISFLLALRGMR